MNTSELILPPHTRITPSMQTLLECITEIKRSHGPDIVTEIFNGAHIVLYDDGRLHNAIVSKKGVQRRRISSHYYWDKSPQYSMSYPPHFPEVLVGINKYNQETVTWFQMERHQLTYGFQSINHFFDFMKYLYRNKNIGPLGESFYTEKNPLILRM